MVAADPVGDRVEDRRGHSTGLQGHQKKLARDTYSQARAYVYAHGGCPDNIPADDMRNIEVLLNDGFLGVKALGLALSALTTGNLNSKLGKGATPYTVKDVLPSLKDYIFPPLTDAEQKEQASRQLLAFMSMAPGAPELLK